MKELPRIPFAHLPTPIESLPRLSEVLGGPQILVKRDDQTGLAFGGNKTRKLEYLVADAQAHNARTLITGGAIQSNHCRQTAAAARRVGMDCILVLSGEEPEHPEGNTYLDLLFGAELVWTTRDSRDNTLNLTNLDAEAAGREPYLIPYGGSNATGAAAYAYAIRELIERSCLPPHREGHRRGWSPERSFSGFRGKCWGSVFLPPQVRSESGWHF
jgi:1-aminocyclopropane-1-carboxylate deaminase/D-cysteine desulfhydrase-like pyridoxal-dependent ACC family enzyme